MNKKDALELAYWSSADLNYHRAKYSIYLWAFGNYVMPRSVLDIGCGPLGGVLPLFRAHKKDPGSQIRCVGVDPLCDEYRKLGTLPDGPEYISQTFESWSTDERFDAIFCMDALDHGEMGAHLIQKMAGLLAPGGRIYLHVHHRPPERLDETHDHTITASELMENARCCGLLQLEHKYFGNDVDGLFGCTTSIFVWSDPR